MVFEKNGAETNEHPYALLTALPSKKKRVLLLSAITIVKIPIPTK